MSGIRTWNNPNRALKVTMAKPNKKVTKKEVRNIARGVVKYMDEIKQEKAANGEGVLTAAAPTIALNINAVGVGPTGATDSSRIGNKIRLTRIEFRISFFASTITTDNLAVRLCMFKTEDEGWGTATALPAQQNLYNTPLVDTYRKRLYDKVHLFGLNNQTTTTDHLKYVTISKKLNNVVQYKGALASDYSQGIFPAVYFKLYNANGGAPPSAGEAVAFGFEASLYFKEM